MDDYDPSKCVILADIEGINDRLFSYLVVGIIIYIICIMLLASNSHSKYRFMDNNVFLVGALLSILILSYVSYVLDTCILFVLVGIFLICWYFNLAYRYEKCATMWSQEVRGCDVHCGNGTSFLILVIVFILWIMILGVCRKSYISIILILPILWYLYILYKWWFE